MTSLSEKLRIFRGAVFETSSLRSNYVVNRGLDDYNFDLPSFSGIRLKEIIDLKLKKEKQIRLLDAGCGDGSFLLECALQPRWKNRLELLGITSYPYHDYSSSHNLLDNNGIQIHVADLHNLTQYIKPDSTDIVTSSGCFTYLAHPYIVLKRIYSVLKNRGLCLINMFTWSALSSEDADLLTNYLKGVYGMEIERDTISFTKTRSRLLLPLRYKEEIFNTSNNSELEFVNSE
ncbi:class I SAM-dependent methyltransferase [Candidatus Gottesmanbacteria bacterium]|nr:class I SAM-dependent methyltransferase [Candidatus Gottesmanbacteria bacterium]